MEDEDFDTDSERPLEYRILKSVQDIHGEENGVIQKLWELADDLDIQQKRMRIARTSFASTGIVSSIFAIVGVSLIPVTFGASLGLTVAGISLGVISAAGEISTEVADKIIDSKTMKEAQAHIDKHAKLIEEMLRLIEQLKMDGGLDYFSHFLEDKIKQISPRVYEILKGFCFNSGQDRDFVLEEIRNTIVEGGKVGIKTGASGGKIALQVVDTTSQFFKVGMALSILTIPFDLATIVYNGIKIFKKTPTETATFIRNIAKELHELGESQEGDNHREQEANGQQIDDGQNHRERSRQIHDNEASLWDTRDVEGNFTEISLRPRGVEEIAEENERKKEKELRELKEIVGEREKELERKDVVIRRIQKRQFESEEKTRHQWRNAVHGVTSEVGQKLDCLAFQYKDKYDQAVVAQLFGVLIHGTFRPLLFYLLPYLLASDASSWIYYGSVISLLNDSMYFVLHILFQCYTSSVLGKCIDEIQQASMRISDLFKTAPMDISRAARTRVIAFIEQADVEIHSHSYNRRCDSIMVLCRVIVSLNIWLQFNYFHGPSYHPMEFCSTLWSLSSWFVLFPESEIVGRPDLLILWMMLCFYYALYLRKPTGHSTLFWYMSWLGQFFRSRMDDLIRDDHPYILPDPNIPIILHSNDSSELLENANEHWLLENANEHGLLQNENEPGVLENANERGLLKNANERGLLYNANEPGLLENANERGLLYNANEPGLLENANGPGVLENANGPGVL